MLCTDTLTDVLMTHGEGIKQEQGNIAETGELVTKDVGQLRLVYHDGAGHQPPSNHGTWARHKGAQVRDWPNRNRGDDQWSSAESARGISPRAAHRSGREPLDSSGSGVSTRRRRFTCIRLSSPYKTSS